MLNYYVLLLVPCLSPAHAVLIQRGGRTKPPVPTVVGTGMLNKSEMLGLAPLFIDAFFDHSKPAAHVILNMKSFETHPQDRHVRKWGNETEWSCEWTTPEARLANNVAVVRGYTNVDALAWPEARNAVASATVEGNSRDPSGHPSFHWAMVISCPTISGLKDSSSARLNLRAKYNGSWAYERYGIPVSDSRFIKPDTDFAICTMLNNGRRSTAEYLKPWVQYHLAVGFTQLLFYVEEKNTSWIDEALHDFIQKDQVTVVPFFFGDISRGRDFHVQGAMEAHCLFQAKGMAKWVAHTDVDEYLDFMKPNANIRNQLPASDSSDVAVVVRNQFWGILPSSHRVDAPYPCHLNAKSIFIHEPGFRSKVILRPDYVDALFPHFVVKQDGYTEVHPDPLTEFRLNHFKWCDTLGEWCFGTNQSEYDATRDRFDKMLVADDSGWHSRCSDILAVKQ